MQLNSVGELPIFNSLIDAVRKEIHGFDPSGTMEVNLADDDNHGNALIFKNLRNKDFMRVTFLYWDGKRYAFRLVLRTDVGYQEERCIFAPGELYRGVRATAKVIKARMLERKDTLFDVFFQEL